jgi:hypothetical protein
MGNSQIPGGYRLREIDGLQCRTGIVNVVSQYIRIIRSTHDTSFKSVHLQKEMD